MNSFMTQLVQKMDNWAQLEKDYSISILGEHDDGSVVLGFLSKGDEDAFQVTISYAGEFHGHHMVEVRDDPVVLVNAVPCMVVACVLEL